jgi:hypothetical protein
MESVMTQSAVKSILEKYFVIRKLVVLESKDKKHLENPGGEAQMEKMGGKNSGIPFFYFTNSKGKLLMNSIRPAAGTDKGGNIGCPYEPMEIDHFMKMLSAASPEMRPEETKTIRLAFEALKKAGK